MVPARGDTVLLDFERPEVEATWKTVNDNVMGGRSKGGFKLDKERGVLVFSGATNTNGGGFSSIRTEEHSWRMGEAAGIEIRFKGDGRTFKADLRKKGDRRWIPVAYRADFKTDGKPGEWQTVRLPFSSFKPTRMGQAVKASPIKPGEIGAIGFMIYDKLDGPFKLEVDWVQTYSETSVSFGDMPPLGE